MKSIGSNAGYTVVYEVPKKKYGMVAPELVLTYDPVTKTIISLIENKTNGTVYNHMITNIKVVRPKPIIAPIKL
jgi:hypothetical protein